MAVRKVRLEESTKQTASTGTRGIGMILTTARNLKGELEEFAKSVSEKELVQLIDEAVKYDVEQKRLSKLVETSKELIMTIAKGEKWKHKPGSTGMVEIKSSSKTEMTATDLARLLDREGKTNIFDNLVNVKVGEAKKILGEDAVREFSKTSTEVYGSISLKPLNK